MELNTFNNYLKFKLNLFSKNIVRAAATCTLQVCLYKIFTILKSNSFYYLIGYGYNDMFA